MLTAQELSPTTMSLTDIAAQARYEMHKYCNGEPSTDQYELELLRRAIIKRDDDAWALWQDQMNLQVHSWLRAHAHRRLVLTIDPQAQNHVDDAFTRFWYATNGQKIIFRTLAGALSYLYLCLHSSVMDTIRAHSRSRELHISDFSVTIFESGYEESYLENELWEAIKQLLTNEREKRLAYLHFHCNLKPREIMHFCPEEFSSQSEIYRIKRIVLDRILRHAHMLRWKLMAEATDR